MLLFIIISTENQVFRKNAISIISLPDTIRQANLFKKISKHQVINIPNRCKVLTAKQSMIFQYYLKSSCKKFFILL